MNRMLFVPLMVTPLTLFATGAGAQASPGQTDPVFLRASQMVTAGQDSAGRAVVDSVLSATAEGTPRYAEALFWRAILSKTAAAAERDYRRIAVEYPLSDRAPEALFRLAQLEMTRGDRASARAHLERIQREHPSGSISTRASVLLARRAFDDGDVPAGCAAVNAARDGLTPTDVELRNQVDYYAPRCVNVAATASRDSAAALSGATNAMATAPDRPADSTVSARSSSRTAVFSSPRRARTVSTCSTPSPSRTSACSDKQTT